MKGRCDKGEKAKSDKVTKSSSNGGRHIVRVDIELARS